ncbi:MAG: hypothetical protein AAF616_11290 [Bacteroidota bacterium]
MSSFSVLLFMVACSGNDLDLQNQPLSGTIGGESWEYDLANAFPLGGRQFRIQFLSENEPVTDACTLPSPGLTHVKAIFVPAVGDFTVSPIAIDENQVQVAFQISPSVSVDATSGFMSIFDINNSTIVGYLQAVLNDDNTVEGAFRVSLCN